MNTSGQEINQPVDNLWLQQDNAQQGIWDVTSRGFLVRESLGCLFFPHSTMDSMLLLVVRVLPVLSNEGVPRRFGHRMDA